MHVVQIVEIDDREAHLIASLRDIGVRARELLLQVTVRHSEKAAQRYVRDKVHVGAAADFGIWQTRSLGWRPPCGAVLCVSDCRDCRSEPTGEEDGKGDEAIL